MKKYHHLQKIFQQILTILGLSVSISMGHAQGIEGTWRFEKAVEYDQDLRGTEPMSAPPYIYATSSELYISSRCIDGIEKSPYFPGGPFQALLKSGESTAEIGKFLQNEFSFNLPLVSSFYEKENYATDDCNEIADTLIVSEDKAIGISAGSSFFQFSRVKSDPKAYGSQAPLLKGLNLSQLPFDGQAFISLCAFNLSQEGRLTGAEKCSPMFFPAVATANANQPLADLVGKHLYTKGGATPSDVNYDNPVSRGLHPVFLVFPPMKDVVLVRVEDFETSADERDVISGVYLSIKDGKVVDQLNSGCNLDINYVCSDLSNLDNTEKYQLLDTGKFIKVK